MTSPQLPPHRHGDGLPRGGRLRRSVLQLAGVTVLVALIALGAGWMFGRVDEPRAARLVLGDEVESQEEVEQRPGPDPDLPTSGPTRGDPSCGVQDVPLAPEDQVATLAAGVVLIQYDPELSADRQRALRDMAERYDRVLLAPAPGLHTPVAATAWRHRYEPHDVVTDRLESFITGYRDRSPDPRPCL